MSSRRSYSQFGIFMSLLLWFWLWFITPAVQTPLMEFTAFDVFTSPELMELAFGDPDLDLEVTAFVMAGSLGICILMGAFVGSLFRRD